MELETLKRISLTLAVIFFASTEEVATCFADSAMPSPIIIDTQIGSGVEDAFALAAAIMSPELEIRGITITGSSAGIRARILGRFLENTAHPRIRFATGGVGSSGTPIDGQGQYGRRPGYRRPVQNSAVQFMYELLKSDPGKITIVCLGPPNNVLELIEKQPDAKKWIRQVILSVDEKDTALEKLRQAKIPLHVVAPGGMSLKMTDSLRKRVFDSKTPMTNHLRALVEHSGKLPQELLNVALIQLVQHPGKSATTTYSKADSTAPHDLNWVLDRIARPSPNPRYMTDRVQLVVERGKLTRVCGYPMEETQTAKLIRELIKSLGKPGKVELRLGPKGDEEILDRLGKLCRELNWNEQQVIRVNRPISKSAARNGLPQQVQAFEDYETEIEQRWWLAGVPIRGNLPPGNTRAMRAMPSRNFDGKMGDFYRPYRAVIFNPVPGPPVGARSRIGFRYHLHGTDRIRVQLYSLSRGFHRSVTLTGLKQGAWQWATADMTEARRPDGSGGPRAKDERIDDIQFYVQPDAELLIDDVVLYDEAPKTERRPFPKRFIFTGWFDTGKQGAEWPGDFDIVLHDKPRNWDYARSVANEKTQAPWIRVHLRGRRPLAKDVRTQFQYWLKDSSKLTVQLYDSKTGHSWTKVVDDLAHDQWTWTELHYDLQGTSKENRYCDEIRFHIDQGGELRIDDLLIYVPET